jgi:hypothetical protein
LKGQSLKDVHQQGNAKGVSYFFTKNRIRATHSQVAESILYLSGRRKEVGENFHLDSPQPTEKARIGRIKPNKSKQFCLDLLEAVKPFGRVGLLGVLPPR